MRLIDADRLLKILKREEAYHSDLLQRADGIRDAIMDVISAPPVDAVLVVRCKDCKFYHRMTAETGICELACRHLGNDGFCSEGEQKTNQGEGGTG